ncbi:hypothetical protein B296_00025255 [Ensete ventricosum]|uniref:Uncharacterized protein n=1 Tax=Ensete ventricosum TaxID=4639 RepID=A0A426ZK77_ENSVE|nr:hypothetical protein B296_00025255 [Ensete ventricosum]
MDGGNTKILDNRNQMRPPSNENWHPPLPISCFPSREVIDDFSSSRSYEEQVPVDPWCASDSLLHVSRIRGAHLGDGAEAAAPTGTSYDPVGLHQTTTTHLLGEATVCMNEPKEPLSFWNIGRFERRNTASSVSPTVALKSNLGVKRSAKFDESLPPKFRKLGNED